jgi:predicted nucleic acid-binding protein
MSGYADTAFVASLFLKEDTSEAARKAAAGLHAPLPTIPLATLELRNTFNLAVARKRITVADRDALWRQFESQMRAGFFAESSIPAAELHDKARELSDRYTPKLATRSLDLLHVAAALLLGAKVFYSFDERQRHAAAGEGLKVKP